MLWNPLLTRMCGPAARPMSRMSGAGAGWWPGSSWPGWRCRQAARWLDVGCGTGALTQTILAAGRARRGPGDRSLRRATSAYAREHSVATRGPLSRSATRRRLPLAGGGVRRGGLRAGAQLRARPGAGGGGDGPGGPAGRHGRGLRLGLRRADGADALLLGRRGGARPGRARRWTRAAASRSAGPSRWPPCSRRPGCVPSTVRAIDVPTVFRDFDDYWTPFLGGQGPAPGYCRSLSDDSAPRCANTFGPRCPAPPTARSR